MVELVSVLYLMLKNSNQSQLLTSLKDKIKNSKLTVSFLTFIPQHATQFRDITKSKSFAGSKTRASLLIERSILCKTPNLRYCSFHLFLGKNLSG